MCWAYGTRGFPVNLHVYTYSIRSEPDDFKNIYSNDKSRDESLKPFCTHGWTYMRILLPDDLPVVYDT
jgi:hypothetical protein